MPDGFHSSSSDVGLQAKYGHVAAGVPRSAPSPAGVAGAAVAPPAPLVWDGRCCLGRGWRLLRRDVGFGPGEWRRGRTVPYLRRRYGLRRVGPRGRGGGGGGGCHRPVVQPLRVLRRRRGPRQWLKERPVRSEARPQRRLQPLLPPPPPAGRPRLRSFPLSASSSLPEGWAEYSDPSTGKPYYYNAATGTTLLGEARGRRICRWRSRRRPVHRGCS